MKTTNIISGMTRAVIVLFFAVMVILAFAHVAIGQTPVTAVFTHNTNATTATSFSGTGATGNSASGLTGNTYTYHFGTNVAATNNNVILDSFTVLGLNYHLQPAPFSVKFRRANNASVTGTRKGFWIQSSAGAVSPGGIAALLPDYDDSLERVFSKQLFNIGIDNVFHNATTTNNNNIERMDVIFSTAVKATDNTKAGFVVFDRGAAGGHDGFYIAAITKLDASGDPLTYAPAVLVSAANYGSGVGGNVTYLILRKNTGDPGLLIVSNTPATQNRDGVFMRFTDLGIGNNINIYGYSVFSTDVVVSPAANMVNYSNATNFPATTDNGAAGGLDPVAVSGLWVNDSRYIILPLSNSPAAVVRNSGNTSPAMSVYPNPVKNKQFNLYVQGEENKSYAIRIFDNNGRLILVKEIPGGAVTNRLISLPAGLKGGMYFAQLADKEGSTIITKMMLIE